MFTTISPMAWALAVMFLVAALFGAGTLAYAQGARGICAHEYSTSCIWIGPMQGNGEGSIVVNGPEGR